MTEHENLLRAAQNVIADGVEIMTPEQVGQWTAVRTVQERIAACLDGETQLDANNRVRMRKGKMMDERTKERIRNIITLVLFLALFLFLLYAMPVDAQARRSGRSSSRPVATIVIPTPGPGSDVNAQSRHYSARRYQRANATPQATPIRAGQ